MALEHLLIFLILFLLSFQEIRIFTVAEAEVVKVVIKVSEAEVVAVELTGVDVAANAKVVELLCIEVNELTALVHVRLVVVDESSLSSQRIHSVNVLWILVWLNRLVIHFILERIVHRLSSSWLLQLSERLLNVLVIFLIIESFSFGLV